MHLLIIGSLLVLACSQHLVAQNTITPLPFHIHFPGITTGLADTVHFHPNPQTMLLGHQWGSAKFRVINQALGCNFTNDHWSYIGSGEPRKTQTLEKLRHLDPDVTNYLGWALGAWEFDVSAPVKKLFITPWLGFSWSAAENAEPSDTWSPRDSTSWPYGFEARHHGYVPSSPADVNYRRYVLHKDSSAGNGTERIVLDRCQPRTQIFNAHGKNPHNFAIADSMSGRRMLLVVGDKCVTLMALHPTYCYRLSRT